MERLTRRMCGGWGVKDGYELSTVKGVRAVVGRLAAYENTGLEPEEITDLMAAHGTGIGQLAEYRAVGTAKHLRELSQAEKDGRLVVLPCKAGDTVYRIIWRKDGSGHIAPATVSGVHLGDTESSRYKKGHEYIVLKKDGGFVAHIDKKEIGKTVFLTRKEAEAAMGGY